MRSNMDYFSSADAMDYPFRSVRVSRLDGERDPSLERDVSASLPERDESVREKYHVPKYSLEQLVNAYRVGALCGCVTGIKCPEHSWTLDPTPKPYPAHHINS